MDKKWLVDVFSNITDAVLLIFHVEGLNIVQELRITRLVIYAIQVILAVLPIGIRPRHKSAYYFTEAPAKGLFLFTDKKQLKPKI